MRKYEGEPDYAAGDYDETDRRFAGGLFFHTVVGWLIIVNVAAYVLEIIMVHAHPAAFDACFGCLSLRPTDVFARGWVWQLLTYAFLHDPRSVLHILFNMLFLYWFGREVEVVWGARRFLLFYLTAAVFAALAFAAVHYFVWPVKYPCVGASGAIMALVMVYALWWPNRTVLFMFLLPMRVRTFVLIVIGIEVVSLLQTSDNGVANLAHLAGLLYGYLIIRLGPRVRYLIR
jgi:membrane associated rhomboid family serine protease